MRRGVWSLRWDDRHRKHSALVRRRSADRSRRHLVDGLAALRASVGIVSAGRRTWRRRLKPGLGCYGLLPGHRRMPTCRSFVAFRFFLAWSYGSGAPGTRSATRRHSRRIFSNRRFWSPCTTAWRSSGSRSSSPGPSRRSCGCPSASASRFSISEGSASGPPCWSATCSSTTTQRSPWGPRLHRPSETCSRSLIATELLRRYARRGPLLGSVGGVARMLLALAIGTALSATIGALTLLLGGVIDARRRATRLAHLVARRLLRRARGGAVRARLVAADTGRTVTRAHLGGAHRHGRRSSASPRWRSRCARRSPTSCFPG